MDQPLITVVIPTFNSENYLHEAIESVINQSYPNLQILILDDGSADDTISVAKSFTDVRIEVYESKENKGQSYQLNKGIAKAKGEYVCIMHSDDVMHKNKLKQQLIFFQKNLSIGVCGCNVQLIGEKKDIWVFPEKDQDCKDLLLSSVPLAHPSVVFKKSVLQDFDPIYNLNMTAAEDYDLWVRLADKTHFGNVQQVLLDYRIHPMQLSNIKKEVETKLLEDIKKKIITHLFKIDNEADAFFCFKALYYTDEINVEDAVRGVVLLWKHNKKNGIFSTRILKGRLKHVLYKILSRLTFKKRIKYILTNSALFEISFLKTMVKIFLTAKR